MNNPTTATINVSNIEWDCSVEEAAALPKTISLEWWGDTLPIGQNADFDELVEEAVSRELESRYGWCSTFDLEMVAV